MSRKLFDEQEALVRAQYPDLGEGWSVQMIGWSIDELVDHAAAIHDRQQALVNDDGLFDNAALEKALGESTIRVEAPKGHQFARLVKPGETSLMVLLRVA